jgi:exosortase/archaeosortase family protein
MKLKHSQLHHFKRSARTKAGILRFPLHIKFLIKRNQREIIFLAKFILFYLIGQGLYVFLRPTISPFLTEKLTAAVSAHILNLLMPGEHALSVGSQITGTVSLRIAIGCDGVEGLIPIIAALCAFPMPQLRKWLGIAIGTMVVYVANLLRVLALYYSLKSYPGAFSFLHMYAGQAYIIFIGFLFILTWLGRQSKNHEEAA